MKKLILLLCLALISGKMLRFLNITNDVSGYKGFGKFKENVDKVCGMYDKVASTFKSESWNYIMKIVDQQGYDKLRLSTNYMSNGGVRLTAWNMYWQKTLEVLDLDEDQILNAKTEIDFAKFSDGNAWMANIIGFDNKPGLEKGETRVINFLTNVRSKEMGYTENKFDAIIFDFYVNFKLAPRLVFRTKGKSLVGGMYNKNEVIIEEQNPELTEAQIDAIMKYFQLLSMELIATIAGVRITLGFE